MGDTFPAGLTPAERARFVQEQVSRQESENAGLRLTIQRFKDWPTDHPEVESAREWAKSSQPGAEHVRTLLNYVGGLSETLADLRKENDGLNDSLNNWTKDDDDLYDDLHKENARLNEENAALRRILEPLQKPVLFEGGDKATHSDATGVRDEVAQLPPGSTTQPRGARISRFWDWQDANILLALLEIASCLILGVFDPFDWNLPWWILWPLGVHSAVLLLKGGRLDVHNRSE